MPLGPVVPAPSVGILSKPASSGRGLGGLEGDGDANTCRSGELNAISSVQYKKIIAFSPLLGVLIDNWWRSEVERRGESSHGGGAGGGWRDGSDLGGAGW